MREEKKQKFQYCQVCKTGSEKKQRVLRSCKLLSLLIREIGKQLLSFGVDLCHGTFPCRPVLFCLLFSFPFPLHFHFALLTPRWMILLL